MRLKNNDLIQSRVFKSVATKIMLEIVLNLQVETNPFQLNNLPLDALFFPNDKTIININSNENDMFSVPIR
jgi:hypothetical protein